MFVVVADHSVVTINLKGGKQNCVYQKEIRNTRNINRLDFQSEVLNEDWKKC